MTYSLSNMAENRKRGAGEVFSYKLPSLLQLQAMKKSVANHRGQVSVKYACHPPDSTISGDRTTSAEKPT